MEQERFTLEIKYNGKTKTFLNSERVNMFLGAYHPGMVGCQVTPELFYRFNLFEVWDDYTEMTAEEWSKVANKILSNFDKVW